MARTTLEQFHRRRSIVAPSYVICTCSLLVWLTAYVSLIAPCASQAECLPTAEEGPTLITYTATNQFPQGADYDEEYDRFLVSSAIYGNIGSVTLAGEFSVWVQDPDYDGNRTGGIIIDNVRHRVGVTIDSGVSNAGYSALAVYDLTTKERVIFSRLDLVGPQDTAVLPFPNDVAVDTETGDFYVTDSFRNLVWKVDSNTGAASVLSQDALFPSGTGTCIGSPVGLNGIAYHPDGYLLVNNNVNGVLFKVTLTTPSVVTIVEGGYILCADGMTILPDGRLLVATTEFSYLVESADGWATAKVAQAIPQVVEQALTSFAIRKERPYGSYAFVPLEATGNNVFYFNYTAVAFVDTC